MVMLDEVAILINLHIEKYNIDLDDIPTYNKFVDIMGKTRLDPIGHRNHFVDLVQALLPHVALILGPLDRQTKSR